MFSTIELSVMRVDTGILGAVSAAVSQKDTGGSCCMIKKQSKNKTENYRSTVMPLGRFTVPNTLLQAHTNNWAFVVRGMVRQHHMATLVHDPSHKSYMEPHSRRQGPRRVPNKLSQESCYNCPQKFGKEGRNG